MLQQDHPNDYVVATGKMHSVREFVEQVFNYLEMPITWQGSGINEVGVMLNNTTVIRVDERYFRPREVNLLCGDATKAHKKLGWQPKTSFDELVKEMVKNEQEKITKLVKKENHEITHHNNPKLKYSM